MVNILNLVLVGTPLYSGLGYDAGCGDDVEAITMQTFGIQSVLLARIIGRL